MRRAMVFASVLLAVMLAAPAAFSMGGISVSGALGGAPVNNPLPGPIPFGLSAPPAGRDIHITGRVMKPGEKALPGATVIRLRLDGQVMPMELAGTAQTNDDFRFLHNSEYGRELQRRMISQEVGVMGSRAELGEMRALRAQSKPMMVRGYIFDIVAPYLSLESVMPAPESPPAPKPAP